MSMQIQKNDGKRGTSVLLTQKCDQFVVGHVVNDVAHVDDVDAARVVADAKLEIGRRARSELRHALTTVRNGQRIAIDCAIFMDECQTKGAGRGLASLPTGNNGSIL